MLNADTQYARTSIDWRGERRNGKNEVRCARASLASPGPQNCYTVTGYTSWDFRLFVPARCVGLGARAEYDRPRPPLGLSREPCREEAGFGLRAGCGLSRAPAFGWAARARESKRSHGWLQLGRTPAPGGEVGRVCLSLIRTLFQSGERAQPRRTEVSRPIQPKTCVWEPGDRSLYSIHCPLCFSATGFQLNNLSLILSNQSIII